MDPHALLGILQRGFGGEELGHSGLHVAAFPAVVGGCCELGQQPGCLATRGHVRQLGLDRLVLADRLAHRLAHLRIRRRLLERGVGDAHAPGGDVDPAEFQSPNRLVEALAFLAADQVVHRHLVVFEHQFGGIDALVADFAELPTDREAIALLGKEQTHTPMPRSGLRVSLDQDCETAALDGVGDPGLGAVDREVVALAAGGGTYRLEVGTAIRLGERQSTADFAACEPRQETFLLRFGSESLHRFRHDEVRVEDARQGHPNLGDSRDDLRVGPSGQP